MSVEPSSESSFTVLARSWAERYEDERWLRRVIPALLIVFFALAGLDAHPHPGLGGRPLIATVALAGFVLGTILARGWLGRQRAVDAGFVAWLFACSLALMWAQPNGPGAFGLFSLVIFRVRDLPARVAVRVGVLAFVLLEAVAAITSGGIASPALLAALAGFYAMTFLATRLGEANRQLEQGRAAEARAAGLAERQRLAREMHDVLAHSLSGLMIQLDGARMLAAESPTDPRLLAFLDRARQLGRGGLDEARRAIGMLRDDELPGPERLADLAARFRHDHAVPCDLTVTGEAHQLTAEARLALYRVAQEALTNISKHAHPQKVEVQLEYEPTSTRLTVEDFATVNGAQAADTVAGGGRGYGLSGMRERAELIGGTLTAEKTGTGFRVQLNVPR